MKWLQNLILFFGAILLYLHIYVHFKISIYNEFTTLEEISKEKILSSIYYKLPFVFDGTTIIKPITSDDLKMIKKENKEKERKEKDNEKKERKSKNSKEYTKEYESLPMLEPAVRFFTKNTIYELKKNKIDIHRNLECRNFYLIHSGKVDIYCIHPKYKHLIQNASENENENLIETNSDMLHVELYPNSILFVPNYWHVYIKSSEKSIVERVQYKTILNEINFLYEKYNGSC
jgi:hypothetical protein